MKSQSQFASIASGATLSSGLQCQNRQVMGLVISAASSHVAYMQGSADGTTYARTHKQDGSGVWSWNINSGNNAIDLSGIVAAFPYVKLETSAITTATLSITAVVKV